MLLYLLLPLAAACGVVLLVLLWIDDVVCVVVVVCCGVVCLEGLLVSFPGVGQPPGTALVGATCGLVV